MERNRETKGREQAWGRPSWKEGGHFYWTEMEDGFQVLRSH